MLTCKVTYSQLNVHQNKVLADITQTVINTLMTARRHGVNYSYCNA